jgi:type IV secretory pathway VirB10-like protein
VSAEYAGYTPETTTAADDRSAASSDYRYDDRAQSQVADADWTTPSRFRDVPRPSTPPQREEQQPYDQPTWRRLTVQEGTPISVKVLESLSTRYTRPGETFRARLANDLLAENGRVAVPAGAEIRGHVSNVKKDQRIGGKASMTLVMDRIELPDGSSAPLEAAWSTSGRSQTMKDAATIGGATVGGAVLGHILDHGNGDVLGGLLGAAAGTAVAHQKIGQPIAVGSGAVIRMHLRAPIDVRVRS